MSRSSLFGLVSCFVLIGACSASNGGSVFDGEGGSGGGTTTADGSQSHAASTGTDTESIGAGTTSTGSSNTTCNSGPNDDNDHDGFTVAQGDCNDCDPNVNPGAIEVVASGPSGDGGMSAPADEDCDGQVDNVATFCDTGLALDTTNAMDAARAIDLCQTATASDKKWGVLSANWVRANGVPTSASQQVGIQTGWGPNVNVQGGKSMLAISSGHARLPGQSGECDTYMCTGDGPGTPPPGFPQDVPNCSGSPDINDDIGLELKIRTPTNATGYSFNFNFYSFEYPEWVCTSYNDQFIALVQPNPMGSINGNVSFDSMGNPVSVNIAFFQVCSGCALGAAGLQGTGFDGSWGDDAGATGWLQTQAPVTGGDTVTIRFAIWDTGDQVWDSTALIDNFQWIANGGSVTVQTQPEPMPK